MATNELSNVEPELAGRPPRNVRPKLRMHFARWLFAAMTLGLPGMLLFLGYLTAARIVDLQQRGVQTVAHIIHKKHGVDGGLPSIAYRYEVDGNSQETWRSVNDDVYAAAKIDDPIDVTYLPEEPDVSRPTSEVQAGVGSDLVTMFVVAAILFIVCGSVWFFSERRNSRLLWLMRNGIATRTTELQTGPSNIWATMQMWVALYAYVANGQTYHRSVKFMPSMRDPLRKPDGPMTVLYDPQDPTRQVLYPTIARLFRFRPSA